MLHGRWKYALLAVAGVLAGLAALALLTLPISSDALRQRVIDTLADRLDSKVELATFKARLFPTLHVEGTGLTIRHRGRTDVPPLISIRSFAVDAGIAGLLRKHVSHLAVTGLAIRIPPGRHAGDDEAEAAAGDTGSNSGEQQHARSDIVIDRFQTTDASLVIIPDDKDTAPKVWSIHALAMHNLGLNTKMPFEATLTNAVPPGEIATSGAFGPWKAADPGATPLTGTFQFDDANLAVFTGVYGTLSAHGTFGGSLGRIDIQGVTDTPDFGITMAGHSVPLHATYHSVVDGTNGNTLLERIEASFLDTSLTAKGAVLEVPGKDGREVRLDVTMNDGRLEDVLRLAVNTPKPPMSGALRLTTRLVIPPGREDVVRKLQLAGRFSIDDARFASIDIQDKLDELSRRSRGKASGEPQRRRVLSDFAGQFRLRSAELSLPAFRFSVPGSRVALAGGYGLESQKLDFKGSLVMAAKVSDTVTGFKHILLKAADPFFRHDGGGSEIPIKITGTRSDPHFGLDTGRIFKR